MQTAAFRIDRASGGGLFTQPGSDCGWGRGAGGDEHIQVGLHVICDVIKARAGDVITYDTFDTNLPSHDSSRLYRILFFFCLVERLYRIGGFKMWQVN